MALCSATLVEKLLNETTSILSSPGIYTFPLISKEIESELSMCLDNLNSTKTYLQCLINKDEDFCDCQLYADASTNCISTLLPNTEYQYLFDEIIAESCSEGSEILDYDESEEFTILSTNKKKNSSRYGNYFDFCCKEFADCYDNVEIEFLSCIQKGTISECKCRFASLLKRRCLQECGSSKPNVDLKFDHIKEQLC